MYCQFAQQKYQALS